MKIVKSKKRLTSEYEDSPKWKLLNNFNIHEDKKYGSGRPFVRRCVPQHLHVMLTSVRVGSSLSWKGQYRGGDGVGPRGFGRTARIAFNGTFSSKITAFDMKSGAVGTFTALSEATIYPIQEGEVGGERNATHFDGFRFSEEVPADGLMAGEPGVLRYLEDDEGGGLSLSLFVDETAFNELTNEIADLADRAALISVSVLCELFQGETGGREYGLLLSDDKYYTRARLDEITILSVEQQLVPDARIVPVQTVAAIEKRFTQVLWVLATILALIVVIVVR